VILGGGVAFSCLFTFVGALHGHLYDSTAFLFIQPFFHSTLTGQTHRQTWSRRQVCNMNAPLAMLIDSDVLIITPKVTFVVTTDKRVTQSLCICRASC